MSEEVKRAVVIHRGGGHVMNISGELKGFPVDTCEGCPFNLMVQGKMPENKPEERDDVTIHVLPENLPGSLRSCEAHFCPTDATPRGNLTIDFFPSAMEDPSSRLLVTTSAENCGALADYLGGLNHQD